MHRNIDTFKLNNSFYNMSQASLDPRELSEYSMLSSAVHNGDEMKKFLNMVQRLASDRDFLKKMNILVDSKKMNSELNRTYLFNLLETIDLIMTKEKLSKESFYEAKKVFGQAMVLGSKREFISEDVINQVN
jgi:hypothetical protein